MAYGDPDAPDNVDTSSNVDTFSEVNTPSVDTFSEFGMPSEDRPAGFDPERGVTTADMLNQQALTNQAIQEARDSYTSYTAPTDIGLSGISEIFNRGAITNALFGPKGFDKSRGPEVPGQEEKGDFLTTGLTGLLESLIYALTLGAADVEFTGKDVFGPDISRSLSNIFGANINTDQPVGVELSLPVGLGGGLPGMALAMATPTLSAGSTGTTAYGGILPGIGQLIDKEELEEEVALGGPLVSPVVGKEQLVADKPFIPSFFEDSNEIFDPSQQQQILSSIAIPTVLQEQKSKDSVLEGLLGGTPSTYSNIYGFAAKKGGRVMENNKYRYGGKVQEYGLGGIVRNLLPVGLGYLAAPLGLPAAALAG
ncbi:MAG: hypothetical protein VW577_06465 [Pelagibacteraceae bacterium]